MLPSVDAVSRRRELADLGRCVARPHLVSLIRSVLEEIRERGNLDHVSSASIAAEVALRAETIMAGPRRVINGSGAVLHTNIGRAPLSDRAVQAMREAAAYTGLEVDLERGRRRSRQAQVEPLLCLLLGCEAAQVVVNNAAAVLLALRVLGDRRDVVLSRGQAVEIGDGFRLPTIIRESRVRLVEVGATNRTLVADYLDAVGPRTAAFLHVHTSNFTQVGFVESATLKELAQAAHRRDILLISDNGSGALLDTARFGLAHEPMPREAIAAGADLVLFSTDKLLGGPQGGVIAGRSDLIEKVRRHPLARSLRPDKVALAGLRATLQQYLCGDEISIPVLRMLAASPEELGSRAARLAARISDMGWRVSVEEGESTIGGGALPGQTLPTTLVSIHLEHGSASLAAWMRTQSPAILTRVRSSHVLIDLRTVNPGDDVLIASQLAAVPPSFIPAPCRSFEPSEDPVASRAALSVNSQSPTTDR